MGGRARPGVLPLRLIGSGLSRADAQRDTGVDGSESPPTDPPPTDVLREGGNALAGVDGVDIGSEKKIGPDESRQAEQQLSSLGG